MRAPPPSLPPAGSRKWHNRRWWDSLGYFRMRTLANPNWDRDVARVARMLRRERVAARGRGRELIDEALRAARWYGELAKRSEITSSADRREELWDRMLAAIDEFLDQRQREHLRAVDEAGRSGRE